MRSEKEGVGRSSPFHATMAWRQWRSMESLGQMLPGRGEADGTGLRRNGRCAPLCPLVRQLQLAIARNRTRGQARGPPETTAWRATGLSACAVSTHGEGIAETRI